MSSKKKTPGRSARKSAAKTPVSAKAIARTQAPIGPERLSRLEEKEELQELNNRLEFYILRQRERDASQGALQQELDVQKQRHAEQLQALQKEYVNEITQLRNQRDSHASAQAHAEQELRLVHGSLNKAQEEVKVFHQREGALRQEVEHLSAQLVQVDSQFKAASVENKRLVSELGSVRRQYEATGGELKQARTSSEAALTRISALEAQVKVLTQDLADLTEKRSREAEQYRKNVDVLNHENIHLEENLRREFTQQLHDILAERQLQFDQEHDEGIRQLKIAYDEKISAYRDHLSRLGHEMETSKSEKAAADDERDAAQAKLAESESIKEVLQRRVQELEKQLEEGRKRPLEELQKKNELLRKVKEAFRRKDELLDELMDLKIALSMEIKAYRTLLDSEEQRLGYQTPASSKKKRRRSGAADLAAAAEEGLIISGMDLEGSYIKVRNHTASDVPLEGWKLQTGDAKCVLEFPGDHQLAPGQSLFVLTHPDVKCPDVLPDCFTLLWSADDDSSVLNPAGDEVSLVSPDGVSTSRMKILPQLSVDDDGEGGSVRGGCLVM